MRPLRDLRPHLNRILKLVNLLSLQRAEAIVSAFELIERPALLLNSSGRVVRMNGKVE